MGFTGFTRLKPGKLGKKTRISKRRIEKLLSYIQGPNNQIFFSLVLGIFCKTT